MENILEIKNLDLFFRGEDKAHQALYDVNLALEKGKIHSVVGESGCGKTMTAMSILRLLPKNAFIQNGEIIFAPNLNCKNLCLKQILEEKYNIPTYVDNDVNVVCT